MRAFTQFEKLFFIYVLIFGRTHAETWNGRVHNMHPFESGVNLEAVLKYWGY
jgi:hypothetical protein